MLSTGDAIRRKGSDTFMQYFLPDRDLTFEESVRLFEALAKNPHTTRFTINAHDDRVFPPDGQQPIRTLTNDQKIIAKASFNDVYEDIDEWVDDVVGVDAYRLAGSFDFDGKWTYLDVEADGTISALFKKDHGDILELLTQAEAIAVG